MEINGFEIEEYNVLKLPTGAKSATCPKCSEHRKPHNRKQKCMSVFWNTGLGQCNHCGERTQLHTYKKKNEFKTYVKPNKEIQRVSIFPKVVLDYYKNHRGITEETLHKCKLGHSNRWMPKAQGDIDVIEYRYFLHDELINIKYRGKNKDFMFEKGCEQIPYGMDDILREKECVVVEGEEDKHAYCQSGIKNCVSVPNGFTLPKEDGTSTINTSYLDRVYHVFEKMEKIYLAVDNDVPGKHGEKELIRRFGAEKCWLVDFGDCKDANDYLKKYGEKALKETLKKATQVPLEGVKTISDISGELDDFWVNGAPKGYLIGHDDFDNCISFSTKQHTLITSAPNSGKSDLLDYFLCKISINYDQKVGICSTENRPLKFHYDKLVKKIRGRRPGKHQIGNEDVLEVKDYISKHFFHVDKTGRYYLQDVLAKFAELVKRKGCRWFVLDPYNKITIKDYKGSVNDYTAEYHNMIDEFTTKYDAHLFLVLHPTKLPLREGSTKTFIMPTAYNIKGGGEHFDMAYNIIGMVRDYDNNIVHVRTLKWKFQHEGTAGQDVYCGWNLNNGRYAAPTSEFDEKTNPRPNFDWDNKNWLTGEDDITDEVPKMEPEFVFDQDSEFDDLPF